MCHVQPNQWVSEAHEAQKTTRRNYATVINPSKAKAGLTATHNALYVNPPFLQHYRQTYPLVILMHARATVGMRGSYLQSSLSHSPPTACQSPLPRSSSCRASHRP